MNIYSFLRSTDISAHCEKIRHEFNPLEMAVVVAISNKPITKKHEAWQWIVENFADSPVRDYNCFDARESLHDFLLERIAWEKEQLAKFNASQTGTVFRPYLYRGYHDRDNDLGCYSTIEKSMDAIRDELDDREGRIPFTHARIYKDYTDSGDAGEWVRLNMQNKITDFSWSSPGDSLDDISEIFIHIPLPFEKGDLVELTGYPEAGPYILMGLPHWHKNYSKWVSGDKIAHRTDMMAWVYYMDDDGQLKYNDCPFFLDEMKFYKGTLKGYGRFLRYFSDFIKGKEKNPDALICAYNKIKAISYYEKTTSLSDYHFKNWTEIIEADDTRILTQE